MIAFTQLSMTYGTKLLFCDVSLNLNGGCAYALVGANGCGKSTLFRLIQGEEELSMGEILIPKDASIGWLKQDQFRYEHTIIRDIVLQGKHKLWQALQAKEALLVQESWNDEMGMRFAELEEVIMHEDGYHANAAIETILLGLGVTSEYHDKPLKALSGGYKLRVLLAQTLFQSPAILLLDEPTNHLDIDSIQWLEGFLKQSFAGMVIFISHDVEFIDHLADHILDIDYGEIRKYSGKYARFLAEKQLIQEQKLIEKKSAEEKIAHMQRYVDRFRATASKAAQARSRMKMIEKIEIPDIINSSRIAPHFQFVPKRPSAKMVCKLQHISKAYQNRTLFKQLTLEIHRGDKLAIIGANGRGKSTLIKILMGIVAQDEGELLWGQECHVSYFSQDHHDLLNQSATVLQWLMAQVTHVPDQRIRQVLGQVLFAKDDVDKNVLSLSGGEAARLLLAKVMLEGANVLVLDEPTNHMDLETIDMLAQALANFAGTVIFVSHNRYFVEKIANRILHFPEQGALQFFRGGYAEWCQQQQLIK